MTPQDLPSLDLSLEGVYDLSRLNDIPTVSDNSQKKSSLVTLL